MYELQLSTSASEVDIIIIYCDGLTWKISESLEEVGSVEEGSVSVGVLGDEPGVWHVRW